MSKLPILGRIFGTTVLAIPVQVSGSADNPLVVPLGPEAIATRFKDIISNTVRLPLDFVSILPFGRSNPAPAGTSP